MKLLLTAAMLLLTSSQSSAFLAPTPFGVIPKCSSTHTALYSRIDSSDAIKAALEASKKYGPASNQARVAWDIVEEMDASDNSNAYTGGVSDEECLTDEDLDEACREYDEKIAALATLLEEQKAQINKVKTLAEEIHAVKMSKPKSMAASPDSSAMRAALADAKAATEELGADSPEAKMAWEAVEEVASSDNTVAIMGSIDDECLVETIEACEAMEELQRAIKQHRSS